MLYFPRQAQLAINCTHFNTENQAVAKDLRNKTTLFSAKKTSHVPSTVHTINRILPIFSSIHFDC